MPKTKAAYIVANPRGIPAGRHILRVGDKRWYEGDRYDGPLSERLIKGGFVVKQVNDGEK